MNTIHMTIVIHIVIVLYAEDYGLIIIRNEDKLIYKSSKLKKVFF
jgi:hypothetical protein